MLCNYNRSANSVLQQAGTKPLFLANEIDIKPFEGAVISTLTGSNPWIMTRIEIVQALDELELGQ
jgi:hypothetical protein